MVPWNLNPLALIQFQTSTLLRSFLWAQLTIIKTSRGSPAKSVRFVCIQFILSGPERNSLPHPCLPFGAAAFEHFPTQSIVERPLNRSPNQPEAKDYERRTPKQETENDFLGPAEGADDDRGRYRWFRRYFIYKYKYIWNHVQLINLFLDSVLKM